ncbi:MAG: alpha/beta hydrolase-fold protein [Candidatus Sericytochromatia bacterium]
MSEREYEDEYYDFWAHQDEYEEDSDSDILDLHINKGTIKRHIFTSKTLSNKRYIYVYLPPNYFSREYKSYPVLYMHDGNNLFDPNLSFGGVTWKVSETIEELVYNNFIEELIVVGISNTGDRDFEYTWTPMYYGNYREGGGGRKYAKMIVNELKPFIDKRYRTLPYRETTGVMGSSLGGVISFYLGLYYPHVFSKIGIMSPSLWWGNGILFKHVKEIAPNLDIWLDMGTHEFDEEDEDPEENIKNVRKFRDRLIKLGYVEGDNLGYFEHLGAGHNEWYWGERLHLPLTFFFGQ